MYAGDLEYGNWNTSKHDLKSAPELTIYEGTNEYGGIQVDQQEIPIRDEPTAAGGQQSVNGPVFQDYPNGSEEGSIGPGGGSTLPSRNPLSE